VALLLPCNVVLEPADAGTRVRIMDPHGLMDDSRFAELADEAATRLHAAVDDLAATPGIDRGVDLAAMPAVTSLLPNAA
jgi:hypothetical protein